MAFFLYTFLSIFEDKSMEENAVNPSVEIKKNPWKECRDFFAATTNGMAIGLFGTLIIGTIISFQAFL